MSLNVIKYAMPSGIPGAPSRIGGGVIFDSESVVLSADAPLGAYGLFGQIDDASGDFRALDAGDAAVYGLLVRPFPTNATTAANFFGGVPLGTQAVPPQTGGMGAAMRAGYMTVKLQANNAGVVPAVVKNQPVYACIQNPPAGGFVGGVTTADGGNTIAVNAVFNGPADADGNVEIQFNIVKG